MNDIISKIMNASGYKVTVKDDSHDLHHITADGTSFFQTRTIETREGFADFGKAVAFAKKESNLDYSNSAVVHNRFAVVLDDRGNELYTTKDEENKHNLRCMILAVALVLLKKLQA